MNNFFITFEGGEGTGKSTQTRLLVDYLEQKGLPCMCTREPGGSVGAEEIRNLVLKGSVARWDPMTETLLMFAARRDHLVHTIYPALEQGKTVICDRFADSTMAYQSFGYADRGLSIQTVEKMYDLVIGTFKPDLTVVLNLEIEKGLLRAQARDATSHRYERMGVDFHHNIQQAFLKIASLAPERCVVVDADQSVDKIHQEIVQIVEKRLLTKR